LLTIPTTHSACRASTGQVRHYAAGEGVYITLPRQCCDDTAEQADLSLLERLPDALCRPDEESAALASYAKPAPHEFMAAFCTFCGA